MKAFRYILAAVMSLLPGAAFADPGHGVEVRDSFNLLHYITSHSIGLVSAALVIGGSYALYRMYRAMKGRKE